MNTPSLKKRISRVSIAAFFAITVVTLTGFLLFSATKRRLAIHEIEWDLKRNAAQQVEQLIPSFLLPEQSAGVDLLLSRFSRDENLTRALVLLNRSELPDDFRQCELSETSPSTCLSKDSRETAFVVPISEGGRTFGYLLKAKHNVSTWAIQDIAQLIGLLALILGLTFTGIYLFLARLLSRTLPSAIDQLVAWIESDLSDMHTDISPLPFRELESLREKISQVLDRHAQDRDQAMIGQLTSGIMHDIRTPLQSVVTAMHLVERYPDNQTKRLLMLENLASMCKENVPIIGEIIETTLDGSRQIQISPKAADLVETVRAALIMAHGLGRIRRANIQLRSPDTLTAPHDPTQLSRVITNLVKNGVEAVSDVTKTPSIVISLDGADQHEVVISIDDNGPGIPTTSSRIFRAFRSSKIHGSGLGLHISRKIVEAHRGSLRASNRSSLGGARFEVRIPRSSEPSDRKEAAL